jgi:hypothetical protein
LFWAHPEAIRIASEELVWARGPLPLCDRIQLVLRRWMAEVLQFTLSSRSPRRLGTAALSLSSAKAGFILPSLADD